MNKKTSPAFLGLLQALGVVIYCLIIGFFFSFMAKYGNKEADNILTTALMLTILVFSAAVTGLIVFGRPVYLVMQKKVKEAMNLLGYTFLFLFFIIIIVLYVSFI
ncbi:hypothetical protein KKH39_01885 [Patescibacteria group bacterium]|nr:hypothetical protein [Patescibacteria group bacterium]